ncbi:MAG: hypothetical protein E7406_02375 [Ruminococcaceae bacterium]|nr:hypothetical protein [Oscillospiraceae bacterium]
MEKINKWMAMMIIGAVAIVAFLFLPFVSFMGESVSFFDMMEGAGDMSFEGILVLLLILGGSGLAAVGGWLKNKLYAFVGPIAAAAGMVYFLFISDANLIDLMDYWGFGLWLSLLAVIANVVLAVYIKKEEK